MQGCHISLNAVVLRSSVCRKDSWIERHREPGDVRCLTNPDIFSSRYYALFVYILAFFLIIYQKFSLAIYFSAIFLAIFFTSHFSLHVLSACNKSLLFLYTAEQWIGFPRKEKKAPSSLDELVLSIYCRAHIIQYSLISRVNFQSLKKFISGKRNFFKT